MRTSISRAEYNHQIRGGRRGSEDSHGRAHFALCTFLVIASLILTSCGPAPAQGAAGGAASAAAEAAPVLTESEALTQLAAVTQSGEVITVPASAANADLLASAVAAPATEAGQASDANTVPATSASAAASPVISDSFPLSHTTNILVLGSDRRPNTPNWRTDVMMVVALDYETGRAGVISIPRDIYIDKIPGHNPNKMNVIDYLGEQDKAGGGPELLAQVIEDKMGIPIDHWVRFDFAGFVKLVDALGGVDVDIDCPYYDYFQIENVILNVKPGVQRLTGDEALVYVRSRKIGGDLDRARRQQRFIWAIRNQVLNENILPKLPALYNAVSDSVQTDLGVVGTLKVARFALGLDREDITGFVIGYPELQQGYVGNMWVFLADWDKVRSEVQKVFERDPFINTNTLAECP